MPDSSASAHGPLVALQANRAGRCIVALVESRALIRDFVTRASVRRARNLSILAVACPEDLRKLELDGYSPAAIILSIGDRGFLDPPVQDELQRTLAIVPNTPLAVLAEREELDLIFAALQRGLKGYLTTSMGLDVTLDAIRLVCTGGTFIPASSLQPILGHHESGAAEQGSLDNVGLTARERDVLTCIREGLANKAIAHKLNMCEGTVKVHVRHIMKKVRATNRTQVVHLTNSLFERRRRVN
jgi:DNA-binding NarL/FixJ family response regulator